MTYPFGSVTPGRSFSSGSYRYGFNGQEKDDEVSGTGNTTTSLHWEYDTRLAKRWNIDPVIKPWITPYGVFSNSPIIFVDPLGNTDFYWKGKWIGTDGKDNGVIAMVNSRDIKKEIKKATAQGQNAKDYHLCSGDANSQFNAIHLDVLKAADKVLDKAISTKNDLVTEHSAVLKENGNIYDLTYESSQGKTVTDMGGQERSSGGTTPEGDVRIHSHAVGTKFDKTTGATKYSDASQPTKCDPVVGGDMCADADYELNIIVGKNGAPAPAINTNGVWRESPDTRGYSINVFGSNSKLKFSITRDVAKSILGGEKNKIRKDKFLEKQKKAEENNSGN